MFKNMGVCSQIRALVAKSAFADSIAQGSASRKVKRWSQCRASVAKPGAELSHKL
jgi:hypothetical protein